MFSQIKLTNEPHRTGTRIFKSSAVQEGPGLQDPDLADPEGRDRQGRVYVLAARAGQRAGLDDDAAQRGAKELLPAGHGQPGAGQLHEVKRVTRLAYVMAFSMAGFESVIDRTTKPFNPLLGETWEYDNGQVRIITEQVSHHPPISAGFS